MSSRLLTVLNRDPKAEQLVAKTKPFSAPCCDEPAPTTLFQLEEKYCFGSFRTNVLYWNFSRQEKTVCGQLDSSKCTEANVPKQKCTHCTIEWPSPIPTQVNSSNRLPFQLSDYLSNNRRLNLRTSTDAISSLVLLDKARQLLSVSKSSQAARNVTMWCDHRAADRLRRSDSPAVARVVRGAGEHLPPEVDVPKLMAQRRTVLRGWSAWASRSSSSTSSHLSAPARSRGRWTLFHASFSTSHLQRDPVGRWVSIARSDLNAARERRCSHWSSCTVSGRHARDGRILCREGDQTQRLAEDRASARRAIAYLRHQHVPDVAGALVLPRAGSVGPVFRSGHQWPAGP